MPRFRYVVRDARGRRHRATVEAADRDALTRRLADRGDAVLSVEEVSGSMLNRSIELPGSGRVKPKALAVLSRQMATMVGAGLPLTEVLRIVSGQSENRGMADALGRVREDVAAGSALSAALAEHQRVFPPLFVSLVRAGEQSGELSRTLSAAAAAYEREHRLHAKIKSAMTYPVIVLAIAFLAVIGIVWTLVPKFEDMFSSLGGQLPLPTRILVAVSHQMFWLGPLLIMLVAAAIVFVRISKDKEFFRRRWHPLLLRIPVIGRLARKLAVARWADTLSLLTSVGVPMIASLELVGQSSGNWVVEQACKDMREQIEGGRSISGAMAEHDVFPEMAREMIGAGEAAGDLPVMLDKVAEFYNADVTEATEQLTSAIEPVMIIVIGAVIGGIVISLYLPMFQINTLISNS